MDIIQDNLHQYQRVVYDVGLEIYLVLQPDGTVVPVEPDQVGRGFPVMFPGALEDMAERMKEAAGSYAPWTVSSIMEETDIQIILVRQEPNLIGAIAVLVSQ